MNISDHTRKSWYLEFECNHPRKNLTVEEKIQLAVSGKTSGFTSRDEFLKLMEYLEGFMKHVQTKYMTFKPIKTNGEEKKER